MLLSRPFRMTALTYGGVFKPAAPMLIPAWGASSDKYRTRRISSACTTLDRHSSFDLC